MSSANYGYKEYGDWRYLKHELVRRTYQPLSDVPFVFYVLLAIIGLGCLGIWVELVKVAIASGQRGYDGVVTALATFFPALVGSSSLQLVLTSTGNKDKVLVSFACLACGISFAAVILISVLYPHFPDYSFWASALFAIGAVWLWCFTNGDDPTYKSAPVDAPSGGDPNRRLKGDTHGYEE